MSSAGRRPAQAEKRRVKGGDVSSQSLDGVARGVGRNEQHLHAVVVRAESLYDLSHFRERGGTDVRAVRVDEMQNHDLPMEVAQGDSAAFGILVRRYQDRLYGDLPLPGDWLVAEA